MEQRELISTEQLCFGGGGYNGKQTTIKLSGGSAGSAAAGQR